MILTRAWLTLARAGGEQEKGKIILIIILNKRLIKNNKVGGINNNKNIYKYTSCIINMHLPGWYALAGDATAFTTVIAIKFTATRATSITRTGGGGRYVIIRRRTTNQFSIDGHVNVVDFSFWCKNKNK